MQTVTHLTAGHELAFGTGQWAGVHHELHFQRWFINLEQWQRFRVFRVGHGTAQYQIFDTGNLNDIASQTFGHFNLVQTLVTKYLANFGLDRLTFVRSRFFFRSEHHHHVLAGLNAATNDLADANTTHVRRVIQCRNLQLQRRIDISIRCRNVRQNGVEQRLHVFARLIQFQSRPAVEARGIHNREIQLFVGSTQLIEQIKGQIHCLIRIGAIAVNLIDQHDRTQAKGQRLLRYEAGLRHRAFSSIHQQYHAVDHAQYAFDFTTEVGVTRGIDDVDVHAVVFNSGVLGKNRDATFLFQIVGVHDALNQLLVSGKGAGLAQQLVN